MDRCRFEPNERIQTVMTKLLETRKQSDVVLRPHVKNDAQYVDRHFWAEKEVVNLKEIFPEAKFGDSCFVMFNISSTSPTEANIKITTDTEVFYDGKKVFPSENEDLIYKNDEDGFEYVHIPVKLGPQMKRVDIKCTAKQDDFSFRYLLSSKVYPFMWAKDYLGHILRTIPCDTHIHEDGIMISELFKGEKQPDELKSVFPPRINPTNKKDFYEVCENENAYVGYAYTTVIKDCETEIINNSPIAVFVNCNCVAKANACGSICLNLKSSDEVLIKSIKSEKEWGFECSDDAFSSEKIVSDRKIGDKWLMIAGFGKAPNLELAYGPELNLKFEGIYRNEFGDRLFWRLQDGSYVRPELDSFFFAQWYYAVMLGHWGIKKTYEYTGIKEWQKYYVDSILTMGKWFEYMQYDYEKLHIVTPFLQRSLRLDHMDPIGIMGMNMCDVYLMTSESALLNTISRLKDEFYKNVPRMEDGIINRINTMWSDDLFMAVPFLTRLAKVFDDESFFDDAYCQLKSYYDKMFIEEEKLFSHIFWVDEYEMSNVPWGRGNGWAAMAMCEYLDNSPKDNKNRDSVIEMLRNFMSGIISHQGKNGLWHQVLNQESTYEETSCTAMFLYSILRCVALGIFTKEEIREVADKAYIGLCNKAIDEEGNISGVCMGSGCSKDWKNYAGLRTVKNDDHGTGIVLTALCEYAKCYC